jgi:hypothetical protein
MSKNTYSNALISSITGGIPKFDEQNPNESIFNNSTISEDIKSKIAKILEVPNDRNWKIQDSIEEEHLYLVHYTEIADMKIYGHLNGIIVDTKNETIVCKGRGYIPTVINNNLVLNENKELILRDENKELHLITNFTIQRGFESTGIYKFKHNGKVYTSTGKSIDASKSHWGKSKTFTQIYNELNGPVDDHLFNHAVQYSPDVHEFLLVHPDILNVTKLPVQSGFLIYLGFKPVWHPQSILYHGYDPHVHEDVLPVIGTTKIPLNVTEPVIYTPVDITLEEANHHLQYGFWKAQDLSKIDERLYPGEFILIYSYDEDGILKETIKVQSESYKWRLDTRNQDANLKHRFFELVSTSYKWHKNAEMNDIYNEFINTFPIMSVIEISKLEEMLKDGPIVIYPQTENYTTGKYINMCNKIELRFYNIFLCFLMCVPLYQQKYVLFLYNEFFKERGDLIHWIKEVARKNAKNKIELTDDKYKRLNNIIYEAQKQANYNVHNPHSIHSEGRSFYDMFSKNVFSFITKERGDSLYKLVKLMHTERTVENENVEN